MEGSPISKPRVASAESLIKGPVKQKLIELARAGISYLDLAKIAKGEIVDQDPSHDFAHTMRVFRVAENLAKETGAAWGKDFSMTVLQAAVCGHDLLNRPKNDPAAIRDTQDSANYWGDILEALGFEPSDIEKTKRAIQQSSLTKGLLPESPEAQVLFIADKLDQSGAIAVMRYFASGGGMNRPFYEEADPFAKSGRKREPLQYTLDALMERIPEIERKIAPEVQANTGAVVNPYDPLGRPLPDFTASRMNEGTVSTPLARQIIKRRNKFFYKFLEELAVEIEENATNPNNRSQRETGAFAIMKAFDKAGKAGLEFYNSDDPFCLHTKTQPAKYPLDMITNQQRKLTKGLKKDMPEEIGARRKLFIDEFLAEIALEIAGK